MEKWTWCWNSLQAVSWACSKWKLDVLQTGEASETSNPSKWQEHFRQPKWHNMLQHFVVIHSFRISKLALHIVHNETDRLGPSYWLRYGFFSLFVESLSESCFLPGFATCRKSFLSPSQVVLVIMLARAQGTLGGMALAMVPWCKLRGTTYEANIP